MKKFTLLLLGLLATGSAMAQDDPESFKRYQQQMREAFERERDGMHKQYDEERKKAEAEFAAFRKKANEEYAEAMRQAWQLMGVEPAKPKPVEPTPPKPRKPAPHKIPTTIQLPQSEVVPSPTILPPIPAPPIPEAPPTTPTMQFDMYGTPCDVHANLSDLRFKLPSLDEKNIANAWKNLSKEKYDGLLHDCLAQRDNLGLADWGYLQLLGHVSEQLLGKGSNEAVLLQMYLLAQSGYRVRIARENNKLLLLVPFNRDVYEYSYITLDGLKHYALSSSKSGNVHVCNVFFPSEQVANILMERLPNFNSDKQRSRTVVAEKFGTMKATVTVNEHLIDFLKDYPLSEVGDYYVLSGLSDGVKATLYPALRSQLAGKSKKKAAIMLLDFVQTGFDYATDQEQFGYERPLFGDESFYYPKNDCEDRSILYSILVRDLLGLDVVLVDWPGHIATAVAFPEEVEGDYFTIDGRHYTVCDPTYVGATVGEIMPEFQGVSAKILKL